MIWICVVLLVIVILIALMFIPIRITIEYKSKLIIEVKFLFFSFKFQNKAKNKQSKNFQKPSKKSKINIFKKLLKGKSISQIAKSSVKVFKATGKTAKYLLKKINLKTFYVIIDVGAKDTSEVALRYGQVSSAVYPLCALITSFMKPKEYRVSVCPNFISEKINLKLKLDFISNFISILFIMVSLIKNFKAEFEKN